MDPEKVPKGFADVLERMDGARHKDAIGAGGVSALDWSIYILGGGAAYGTYMAVQDLGFPQHREYDRATQVVNTLNNKVLALQDTKTQMTQNGVTDTKQVDTKIGGYKKQVGIAEKRIPPNYNHNLEEGASWAGALVVGAVVCIGLNIKAKRIIKRNKKIEQES